MGNHRESNEATGRRKTSFCKVAGNGHEPASHATGIETLRVPDGAGPYSDAQLESIRSTESTLRKLERALSQMRGKGVSTTLVESRLLSMRIGLDAMTAAWEETPFQHDIEAVRLAFGVLVDLRPSIVRMQERSAVGTPQRTLLDRRLTALDQSLALLAARLEA